jgi:hypothetical protein
MPAKLLFPQEVDLSAIQDGVGASSFLEYPEDLPKPRIRCLACRVF